MYILGINAFHADSSACIIRDGEVIAAIEEERIKRLKHWAGFPLESIKFCLSEAGISVRDLDHVCIGRDPKAKYFEKILHIIKNQVSLTSILDRYKNSKKITSVNKMLSEGMNIPDSDIKAHFHNIEHHRSHMASSFFASPFEEAAILSVDGFGDFTSTMIGKGFNNKIEILESVSYPHSLGIFYTAFTQYLGFNNYGDEYKVMGLAPYGSPVFVDKLREVVITLDSGLFRLNEKYFRHVKEGVEMTWEGGEPVIGKIYSDYLIHQFGKPRGKNDELTQEHKDLAASVQKITEEILFHILEQLYKKTKLENLCVTGGVAQNSVANGKMYLNSTFKKIYAPPAGHDAGISIGAALYCYNQVLKQPRMKPMMTSALGSKFSNEEIEKILQLQNIQYLKVSDDELFDLVSDKIIDSGVIGWFQGRSEFGPRALGHRSILADPRRADAKDLLNLKIKRRESFRPFAPSILKEFVSEYFEYDADVPFMEKVFKIKEEKRKIIPAVTHVDGTGRLQTVDAANEPKYHGLISAFYKKTNVPILLNTSFNENEPIVNTPHEALDCFLRTKMDMLVLENCVITRV